MKYNAFGNTGIKVSALSFGTMTFGKESDEAAAQALYRRCREAGINLFDCADMYQNGKAEEMLGRLIQDERKEIILTSKVYFPMGKEVNSRGLSRRHILQSLEASLKRLKTDYLDIYFMHRFDEKTPLEESLRAMEDLVRAGKVIYLGASNFSAWQIMKGLGISSLRNETPFRVIQPMYNLLKRQAEVEILPLALAENLAVLSYSPLGAGLLTGKYLLNERIPGMRLHEREMYQVRYQNASYPECASRFVDFAQKRGFSPTALAIAWVASHPAVTSPLLGARNVEQLNECLKALEITMTPDLKKEISLLSPEPPPATDRSDEITDVRFKQ
ncbi:MAG: aldo/keto reductase [Chlamydiae bacterium GWC2_50_10]|nr:MAG: aldo/keto reductase [Chlamydiae bacterium GWC2_50_10]OGN54986.1 MAG: aldo/keto reductase [Chlamydiae bacterium GWF2_49_8]OGN57244.1 MAG: aldo/keto reductase [Chlamydiae bacterium RIFCSPHIGHO2_02_FULL_49_29]OGN63400.1 MAG: aldo/keto reductase [Chlamydiae bacterium RIFCSPHIGHO2_12_FULL_49_32]OGN69314.1 MAG: aldo/keto reductase [Chlamydiae bacterium RIFCSPLOWO2_02_FULL_49_12]OGN74234.1 MAG: aldo/keto reductase [Chlamydiae bacterium RIFCSPLOWO2_12_FULL_49_12]HAZ15938.1 aldo/keto reductase